MSDRKTSKEIQAEIDALTDQLAATLRLEIVDLTRQAEEGKVSSPTSEDGGQKNSDHSQG